MVDDTCLEKPHRQDNGMFDAESPSWEADKGPLDDPEERRVLYAALDSFCQYRKNVHFAVTHRRRQNIYALPQEQWKLLAAPPFKLLDTLSDIDDAIDENADLADAILETGLEAMGLESASSSPAWHNVAKPNDHAKAHSTVRQIYRDWSAEGFQEEVKPILDLILADLHPEYPTSSHAHILLPGAGLGRLLFELTLAGYYTTGNEISYHQILASNLILNHTPAAEAYNLHPFLSTFTNNLTRASQLSSFKIPDIHPSTALASAMSSGYEIGSMSMASGDFITTYSSPDAASTFDAIVTVYFIDTSPNLIRYIRTVYNALKPGGLWINIGPLLWHFDNQTPTIRDSATSADNDTCAEIVSSGKRPERLEQDSGIGEPGAFELSNDEVLLLIQRSGFTIEKSEVNLDAQKYGGYIQDRASMLMSAYRPVHWVARKVVDQSPTRAGTR